MKDINTISNYTGEITTALNKLRGAEEQIEKLRTAVALWELDLEVEVVKGQDGKFGVELVAQKKNGQGVRLRVEGDDVNYYASDVQTLVESLASDIYERLYENQIIGELGSKVQLAVANAAKLNGVL